MTRRGVHRLECAACGAIVYSTVPTLESKGLPLCDGGGQHAPTRFDPESVELAEHLGVHAPAVDEYVAELRKVQHGQAPHGLKGRELRPAESVAFERVERRRREMARARRLDALKPAADPIPF